MKPEFLQYLERIGMTEIYIKRVVFIFEMYKDLFPEDIEDIFVEDYIDSEDKKVYTSISFLSENFISDVSNFITKDDHFFTAPIKNQITNLAIDNIDYNFKTYSNSSRLTVQGQFAEGSSYLFKASRDNCEKLRDITKKYFYPNFKL